MEKLNNAGIPKKNLKKKFQLVFEFVNKVVLPDLKRGQWPLLPICI